MAGKAYFSKQLFEFFDDLRANNNRQWFQANRDRYEEFVKEPCLAFIADAAPHLRKISRNLIAEPRASGGSLFRINRDVRFSKDKSPYKTNAGLYFRHDAGKEVSAPGYYLHLDRGECFAGGGIYMPDSKGLRSIREAIAEHPAKWRAVRKAGIELSPEDSLVRAPQGFPPDHPLIEDLKLKHFVASERFGDHEVCGAQFMEDFVDSCRSMQPLMKFLAFASGVPW
jgi:uncharacterized protein (TIGR02453 family)